MNSMFAPPIKYLSHEDFVKLRLFDIHQASEGTFEKHIDIFDNDIREHYAVYGYCPMSLYREKRDYIREWGSAWKNSKCICVDVTTGEVIHPLISTHQNERS